MKLFGFSWSVGRWRGVDIRFHISTLFAFPAAYWLFRPVDFRGLTEAMLWALALIFFILLHELGHALAAQAVGVEVRSVVIWLMGGLTNLAQRPEKPSHSFFVYAAGPLMNMLLAFICVVFYMLSSSLFINLSTQPETYLWAQTFQQLALSLTLLNLMLVVFNLIPVYPLDGGNLLHAASEWFFGRTAADRITLFVGMPLLLALIWVSLALRDYFMLLFCLVAGFAIVTLNPAWLKFINTALAYIFKRAAYLFMKGDYERAAQYYTTDIDENPEDPANYLARAGCYLALGQIERARADVERVLRKYPLHLLAIEFRAEIRMLEKNFEEALIILNHVLERSPNWSVPYFDRGSLFLEKQQLPQALADLNKAIAIQRNMALFYVVRSIVHFKLGNFSAAHQDQDTAIGLSADEALIMIDVNKILYDENLDWAQDYYGRLLKRNPHHGLALQGLAEACLQNQKFAEAESLFTRAINVNPKEARLYLGRGVVYQARNEINNAQADFEKAQALTEKLHIRRLAQERLRSLQVL